MEALTTLTPLYNKYALTIKEASEYFGIGEKKLYTIVTESTHNFVLHIGKKILIKRKLFERYLDNCNSI